MIAHPEMRDGFREAMARLGAAVNVITTDGRAGRAGFTATAVCSLSANPPSILVCMNRGSAQNPVFRENAVLCVNILAEDQRSLSERFAGVTRESTADRFAAAQWERAQTGSPMLIGAVANVDARISQVVETATHDVMICVVTQTMVNDKEAALVYCGRAYHGLPLPEKGGVS